MTGVFLLDAVRTPVGRYRGAYATVRPDDLAATVVRALVARRPGLDPAEIDDVVLGDANGSGEDNRDVARMAVLLAGLPPSVPGVTVNRLCGSGLEAVVQASRAIETGDASICIAGGVESMTRAPHVTMAPGEPLLATTHGWRLVNPAMPPEWTVSLGEVTEQLARARGIGRDDQDAFALASHRKAAAAWDAGRFAPESVPVGVGPLDEDEGIRRDTSAEALAVLKPAFADDGTITAGNASPLSDGSAAVLLADESAVNRLSGAPPLARVAARAVTAVEPQLFGVAPVAAAEQALKRAGIGWGDLAVMELNEAFAAQALACLGAWPDLDPAVVNPNGGAIAIGHPLGASGARILTSLAWELRRLGGGWGMAAICVGVGQGIAVVIEA